VGVGIVGGGSVGVGIVGVGIVGVGIVGVGIVGVGIVGVGPVRGSGAVPPPGAAAPPPGGPPGRTSAETGDFALPFGSGPGSGGLVGRGRIDSTGGSAGAGGEPGPTPPSTARTP